MSFHPANTRLGPLGVQHVAVFCPRKEWRQAQTMALLFLTLRRRGDRGPRPRDLAKPQARSTMAGTPACAAGGKRGGDKVLASRQPRLALRLDTLPAN